jgi:phosphoserine phosphatase
MSGAIRPQRLLDGHFRASERLSASISQPGCVWVTDADGTLWSDDIGERFLQRLIADKALVGRPGDVWAEYEARVAADKGAGYAWAARAMAGMSQADVEARARAFAAEFVPAHLYASMRALADAARAHGCEAWIVSASPELLVKAAAPLVGIDPARAVGMQVAVAGGILQDESIGAITYRQGKVEAIRARIGRMPTLVSGDSAGDVEMFGVATQAALFVRHSYTDPELLALAASSGWIVEAFERW